MKNWLLLFLLTSGSVYYSFGQAINTTSDKNQKIIAEIKRLMDYELKLVLHQDTTAMEQFYPDDMVVTNPFNQFIDKRKVMERVKSDIIKYTSYEKKVDYFHVEGENTVVVIGSEVVVPTTDANRTDAGKIVNRRFTEVWMKRGKDWKKVVRHANNIIN
ncbi:nuclear transport factor 2 family protein [Adhaeribacter radiodurans]|uniref:Nuclear transport factor 2 family protein n=1 Tax=Adhaeribacter radiodurans TaxID=2745197 RepID=A0A7L7LAP1_9BACT|nr:nuclear transport factor 2 family protein [Adhaeribacter radiodurans]QMU29890.1 nuclear transport factor 2 family protein [Adhaeribacter radiodurans]